MRRIAISGHRGLPEPTAGLVDAAIRAALADQVPDVTGISCLADGADQIFARAVIDLGGKLEVVIPATAYRAGLPDSAHREYDRLLAQAVAVQRLPFTESTSQAHMAASKVMLGAADELYAVWDGQPSRGYGGTADVVSYARERGVPVRVIWPASAQRDLRSLRLTPWSGCGSQPCGRGCGTARPWQFRRLPDRTGPQRSLPACAQASRRRGSPPCHHRRHSSLTAADSTPNWPIWTRSWPEARRQDTQIFGRDA
jgi:hypothetical protein